MSEQPQGEQGQPTDRSRAKPLHADEPAIEVFHELDMLWYDTQSGYWKRGIEAHEKLFGKKALRARLVALDARRGGFQQRFRGAVLQIADFAVTSGHEAVAFFAGRVAGHIGVR